MGKQNTRFRVKPCPFCGSIPKIDTHIWKHIEDQREPCELVLQRVIIKCQNCFCQKDIECRAYAGLGLDEKSYRKIAKQLARRTIELMWNVRSNNG